tara:strand:+ start:483 stop:734 length:252 start_codon:yes stop_codon:yes gene_type:complete
MIKIYASMMIAAVAWCAAAQAEQVELPKETLHGEIDIWNVNHLMGIEHMFIRNARIEQIEKNMTQPVDAIDAALENFEKNINN